MSTPTILVAGTPEALADIGTEFVPATTPAGPHLSALGIIRSEWIKLSTVRSTIWCFAVLLVVSMGLAAIMSLALDLTGTDITTVPGTDQARFVAQASTFGVFFGQLIVAVLGALAVTGEFTTGMIRSTLTAVPKRLPALWAKALVLFVATFVAGLVSNIAAYVVTASIVSGQGLHASLFAPEVILPVLGGSLYLALVAVFALGIGTIVRSGAGSIAVALGVILLLPVVLQMIPATWASDVLPYLISSAGISMFGLMQFAKVPLDWSVDLIIVLVWVVVSLGTAAVLLKRRDA
ncbi:MULTISPECIES: ABC transporter permease subunit [unclassified Cryobacterium]|uniref:ABC transporter permease subunit n=1 Tax=unclassified Cryobacterium TaxID=2649013 RepID=UPI002AB5AB3E|nr:MULTISPECIES: ABC transporter permease subunit [unclassified Cryobacterium]MDY7529895.1 ABC transporter permease subunit [Cryobacterium sp. 10C2]MDY7557967.1 ABC transporter permease subunit [Cryobacterium sp. 10C3]MEB0202618.1 ABC transporter permease subunit [Cryobacterium sp. 5I3]MEB0291832.1 ABC transporter permease subunit [Cryobacterium sp. 10C2]